MKMRTLKNWHVWLIILASSMIIGWGAVEIVRFVVNVIVDVVENLVN